MELSTQYAQQYTTDLTKQQQIEQINQVLIELAGGNYHQTAPISDAFDEIDAIASGVNMLSEELRDTVISRNYLDSVLRSIVDMLFSMRFCRMERSNFSQEVIFNCSSTQVFISTFSRPG